MKLRHRTPYSVARLIFTVFVLACLALAGCASTNKQDDSLEFSLQQYEKIIRWSQWDGAVDFLAPEYIENNTVTRLDMDRLRLFRVTAYVLRSSTPFDDGMGLYQTLEIRMFNKNRAVERTFIDQQEWRYNSERERWFLHTGLPDVTKAR